MSPTSRAARLYERLGPWYLALGCAGVGIATALGGTAFAGAAGVGYLDVSREFFVNILLLGGLGSIVATALSCLAGLKLLWPVFRWLRSERTEELAPAAWTAATRRVFPTVLVGVGFFSVAYLPAELYAMRKAELSLAGSILLWVGVEIIIGAAALVDFFGIEGLMRPILRDVSSRMPVDFEFPSSRLRLRRKLIVLVSGITLFTGAAVAAVPIQADTPEGRLATGIGVAFVCATTVSLLLTVLVTRSVASPVERLVRASKAVQAGNLSTRVPVTSADELGVLGQSFNEMVRGIEEREALRAAMGSYVYPEVARRILDEGQLLEGRDAEVTVLFLDIRGFTSLAEDMSAAEVVVFLNRFFHLVVPIIDGQGGHVNKFTGDGLLAVFGVPETFSDHADRAVAAARSIARCVTESYPSLGIGIGLNSGTIAAGTVGGGNHLEYALIGDTVNIAARVEQLTKDTGDMILMTEATRRLCASQDGEQRQSMPLRGVSRDVNVYALRPEPARVGTRSTSERVGETQSQETATMTAQPVD